MRFEAKAALVIGILLPLLETYRRGIGEWSIDFTTMFEDYLAGALLLVAAWSAYRGYAARRALLLVAWAWVTGLITISFVSQVEETIRGTDLEPRNTDVLAVKFLLFAVCATALLRSFRSARESGGA